MKPTIFVLLLSVCYIQAEITLNSTVEEIKNKETPADLQFSTKAKCPEVPDLVRRFPYGYYVQVQILKPGYVIGCYDISGSHKIISGGIGKRNMKVECWENSEAGCEIEVYVKSKADLKCAPDYAKSFSYGNFSQVFEPGCIIGSYNITGNHTMPFGGVGWTSMRVYCWDNSTGCRLEVQFTSGAVRNGLFGGAIALLFLFLHKFM